MPEALRSVGPLAVGRRPVKPGSRRSGHRGPGTKYPGGAPSASEDLRDVVHQATVDSVHQLLGEVDAYKQKMAVVEDEADGQGPSTVSHTAATEVKLADLIASNEVPLGYSDLTGSGASSTSTRSPAPPAYGVGREADPWELVQEDLRLYTYASGASIDTARKLAGKARNLVQRHRVDKQVGYADRVVELIRQEYFRGSDVITFKMRIHEYVIKHYYSVIVCSLIATFITYFLVRWQIPVVFIPFEVVCVVWLLMKLRHWWRNRTIIVYGGYVGDICTNLTSRVRDVVLATISGRYRKSIDDCCKPKKYPVGFTIAKEHLWIPRRCAHNEERAIIKRQLLPEISSPDERAHTWSQCLSKFERQCVLDYESKSWFDYEPTDDQSAAALYESHLSGRQKRVYLAGKLSLESGSIPNCRTSAFVKLEWLTGKKYDKLDPRLISGKTPEYLAATGPGYYHFQKQLVSQRWSGDYEDLVSKHFLYPGGIDAITLGKVISHYETLGWYVYEGDFSRYDGHTEVEALEAEFSLYERAGLPTQLLELLHLQKHTIATGQCGSSFSCIGKRSSGVINTTMGNTLCGMVLLCGAMSDDDYYIIQLGDDNVILTKRPLDVDYVVRHCARGGHKLELISRGNTREAYDNLEFCSSIFWDVGEHRVLGPKPFRALAKAFMPSQAIRPTEVMGHVAGVALGYKHYRFIPILSYVVERILQKAKVGRVAAPVNPYRVMLSQPVEFDEGAILRHFEDRYGCAPHEVEKILDDFDFSKPGSIYHHLIEQCAEIDGVLETDSCEELVYSGEL